MGGSVQELEQLSFIVTLAFCELIILRLIRCRLSEVGRCSTFGGKVRGKLPADSDVHIFAFSVSFSRGLLPSSPTPPPVSGPRLMQLPCSQPHKQTI